MNKFNVNRTIKFSELILIERGGFAVNSFGLIYQRVVGGALKWANSVANPDFLTEDQCRGCMVQPCDANIQLTPREL